MADAALFVILRRKNNERMNYAKRKSSMRSGMDYFELAKKITRAAWPAYNGIASLTGPDSEVFECEWCHEEFTSEADLDTHADYCDRLYLAKW